MKKQFISKKSFNFVSGIFAAAFLLAACAVNYGDGYNMAAEKGGYYKGYDEGFEDFTNQTGDKFEEIKDNPFINTADENVSTFSLDADSAAYSYMRASIKNGMLPNKNSVRIEEYLNYFTFDYEDPTDGASISLNSEISSCPWNDEEYF